MIHRRWLFALALGAALVGTPGPASTAPYARSGPGFLPAQPDATQLGRYVLLSWNDLGMHCMNKDHARFSVLPPYNNLRAQVIERGDEATLPRLVTSGVALAYSIPGNTYSVGKTDFWTYANALFGVTLPPDVGLTGKGLTGTLDPIPGGFAADGIPVTPFTDAMPTIESPYQQALIVARDAQGTEIARSTPTIPVSVELSCVSSNCHASETAILNGHENEHGFDPGATPILCASCHADPILGAPGEGEAGYFSFRMHDAHKFTDEQMSGVDLCYQCHPGQNARCLRGVMNARFGMECQDCHGSMQQVATSIEHGRTPWLDEPACRDCHTERFGEPVGQLYRVSSGHGGVMCEGCHHSTHAEWPSGQWQDNINSTTLQGSEGVLTNCSVCHGITPTGAGPHDILATSVANELLDGAKPLTVVPNPMRTTCVFRANVGPGSDGRLLVYDSQGRIVRLLRARPVGSSTWEARWDGLDAKGRRAAPGIYFATSRTSGDRQAARFVVVE